MEEVGKNLQDLEKIVQGKQGNLNVVEDGESLFTASFPFWLKGRGGRYEVADEDSYIVLRQKVISENSNDGADSGT